MKQLLLTALVLALAPVAALAQGDGTTPDATTRAWQQDEPYVAPDFEGYFPDDPAGAVLLDEHFEANTLRKLDDTEFLSVIRGGLRHTTNHRTILISYVGNRFIWGKAPQDPDAIELCYHAADFTEAAEGYGARHYAVYFGLSVVTEKTPAILRTLTELCVAIDDPNDIGRVGWGTAEQLDELLPYLEPWLADEDRWVREKAEAVQRIWKGEVGAFEWAAERAKLPPRPKPWKEMPEVRAALTDGDSATRAAMLDRIVHERLYRDMNDSYLADLAAAAADADPKVRRKVTHAVSYGWISGAGLHRMSDPAVDLVLELSADADADVRYDAVYYGLSGYRGEREDVLRRMVAMATSPTEARSHDRLDWALERFEGPLKELLTGDLSGDEPARARDAYELWRRVFEERPAITPAGIAGPGDLVGTWVVTIVAGGRENLRMPPLVVEADEAGILRLVGPGADEFEGNVLGDLAWQELDETLHFSFVTGIETAVLRSSAKLDGDHIEGTSRLDGGDTLVVWTAARQ